MLRPESLTNADIFAQKNSDQGSTLRAATRYDEPLRNVPFTAFVITAEEILRNGYVTLTDVLQGIPGIRISQPGNALEGETFLMRGLTGNQHMKILINDVPVKPYGTLGMPIGAQLPIRQAERIEVVLGPFSSVFGNDATAGVINIILKESDRPIFTQAELSFGNLGYNSIDLMCAGRLGRDDRIFRFSIYGSSTVRDRTDIFWEQRLFDANQYVPAGLDSSLYSGRRNFIPEFGSSSSQAQTNAVSHESRLFGIRLSWRGLQLTMHRMIRIESQALGLNPLAQSYANTGDQLSERIQTATLGWERKLRNRQSNHSLSVVSYRIQEGTVHPVFDRLQAATYAIQSPTLATEAEKALLLDSLYSNLAGLERYNTALTLDLRAETRTRFEIGPQLNFDLGATATVGSGIPLVGYFRSPPLINFSDGARAAGSPFAYSNIGEADITLNFQLDWRSDRIRILAGAAGYASVSYPPFLSPRFAALYHINKKWTAYGYYSTGFRRPPLYALTNSFAITSIGLALGPQTIALNDLEKTDGFELGLRNSKDSSHFHVSFVHQNVYNLLRNGQLSLYPEGNTSQSYRFGWVNTNNLSMNVWGINAYWTQHFLNNALNISLGSNRQVEGYLRFGIQYSRGSEWFGTRVIEEILNMPKWHTYFELMAQVNNFSIMLSSNRNSSSLSKSVAFPSFYGREAFSERLPVYRTWQVRTRYYLSKQFVVYMHLQNIFNTRFAGLDATGTPDDLLFNPQQGRLFRIGVNYNMK